MADDQGIGTDLPEEGDEDDEESAEVSALVGRWMDANYMRLGPFVVEHNRCPHCGELNRDLHAFSESIECSFCQRRYPSMMRRNCIRHEEILTNFHTAVQQMLDLYPTTIFGDGTDDLAKVKPEVRALVQSKAAHLVRCVLANLSAELRRLNDAMETNADG